MRLALALFVLGLAGCQARRTLTITSDPPGALVRLDDQEVGTTPRRIAFEHYGIRRVTLYKDGYRTLSERIELRPPWYSRFPLDVVSEVLLPLGLRDRRVLHLTLEKGEQEMTVPALSSVFERADILRRAGPEGPRDLPVGRPRELPAVDSESEETGGPEEPEGPRGNR